MNCILPTRFFGSLFSLLACLFFSQPLTVNAGTGSKLESQIEKYIKSLRRQGRIPGHERTAWSVYDFTTGKKLVSINEDMQLQAASMIKPFLALAFFHKVKEGGIVYGPTSRKHMELMIQVSNNPSTNWVMKQVGGPGGAQAILNKHYPFISENIKIVEYIPAGGKTYRNKAAASNYSRFLFSLWKGQLPHGKEILRLMNLPGNDRLFTKARRIPHGTIVYNKTGSTSLCCGDMGILSVKDKNGRRYAYTVIGIIDSWRKPPSYGTWISSRANVIREVSNIIYLDMKQRHNL